MQKLKKIITAEKNYPITVPIIAIISAFLLASLILVLTGLSPVDALKGIFQGITGLDFDRYGKTNFFNPRKLGEFGVSMIPITLTGLSFAFAARTGLFNIGSEGQLMMGSLFSISVALLFDLPKFIHLPLAILAGAVGGAILGGIPGLLKAKYRVNEVVVCIMLNHAALWFTNLCIQKLPGYYNLKTPEIPASASLKSEFLASITKNSRFHWGFIVVIIAIFIFHYIIEKTSFGYELRAVGYNKYSAEYAGMKVNRNIILSMAISGAFAGLAGSMIVLGTFGYGRYLIASEGVGFTGIAVALVGGNTAIGTLFAGIIFGGLENSARMLQIKQIPLAITMIISSLIILFVGVKIVIQNFLSKIRSEKGDK